MGRFEFVLSLNIGGVELVNGIENRRGIAMRTGGNADYCCNRRIEKRGGRNLYRVVG